jgi:TRAP-type transport system periplasmic protein
MTACITRRAALAGMVLAAAGPARAETMAIRVSTAAPPSDFLAKALEQFKGQVEAGNAGLSVQVFPASTLFRQGTEVPALQRGNLEMSTMTTFEVAQQVPRYGFFNRAYMFRDYAHLRATFDGPIGAAYRQAVQDTMGITILATAYLGTRQVNLRTKRKVAAPADLAGVKLRMPAGPEWLLLGQTLGVSPVPLAMPEVYLAMKTGTIDGQENPLSILAAAKLYEVSEQVVLTSHLVQPVFLNIATPFYEKLSAGQQKLLQDAALAAAKANDAGRLADEQSIAADLVKRGLVVDRIDLTPFRALADKVYAGAALAAPWDAATEAKVLDFH